MQVTISSRATLLVAVAVFLGAAPAVSQVDAAPPVETYEREIFYYDGLGRVDPFRSLLDDGEVGVRIEDLGLRGIVYHSDPARSVAILTQVGSDRRIQARVGERVGSIRVVTIYPDRVDIVVEQLGVARRETLRMEKIQPEEGAR